MSESRSGGGAHQVGDTYGASPGQKIPGLLYMDSEEGVDAAGEYLDSFQRTAAAVGDLVNAVVTGPARPKSAMSLSATNRDEPRTPEYIPEALNLFSTSLVP